MKKSPKFSPEVRERAVRMVQEHCAKVFQRRELSWGTSAYRRRYSTSRRSRTSA